LRVEDAQDLRALVIDDHCLLLVEKHWHCESAGSDSTHACGRLGIRPPIGVAACAGDTPHGRQRAREARLPVPSLCASYRSRRNRWLPVGSSMHPSQLKLPKLAIAGGVWKNGRMVSGMRCAPGAASETCERPIRARNEPHHAPCPPHGKSNTTRGTRTRMGWRRDCPSACGTASRSAGHRDSPGAF
jgi:hypothetical protein